MNDWIGAFGGHPLAQTPNLDRLAARGTIFHNAHCNAPLCNPSRTSLMLGLRPSTTGIYGLAPWFRTVEALKDRVALPQHFAAHGYRTPSTGKVYHGGAGGGGKQGKAKAAGSVPEFQVVGSAGGVGVKPPQKLVPPTPMGNNPLVGWGVWPLDNDDTGKGDYQVASWTIVGPLPREDRPRQTRRSHLERARSRCESILNWTARSKARRKVPPLKPSPSTPSRPFAITSSFQVAPGPMLTVERKDRIPSLRARRRSG